jgi:hypothetical protein
MDHNSIKPSKSLKKWPIESNPGPEAWKIWKHFITRGFLAGDNTLSNKLGSWVCMNKSRSHYAYFQSSYWSLWISKDNANWTNHKIIQQGRRHNTFSSRVETTCKELPPETIPIKVISQTEQIYVTE